jgi:hypothetical protein
VLSLPTREPDLVQEDVAIEVEHLEAGFQNEEAREI